VYAEDMGDGNLSRLFSETFQGTDQLENPAKMILNRIFY